MTWRASWDATVNVADLDMTDGYDSLRAYKASKLANVLSTGELRPAPKVGDPERSSVRWCPIAHGLS